MIDNRPIAWDFTADVVAIGSGAGGLSAAVTAAELGASAMVLERTAQIGGDRLVKETERMGWVKQ